MNNDVDFSPFFARFSTAHRSFNTDVPPPSSFNSGS
jgi:hypothetical protein